MSDTQKIAYSYIRFSTPDQLKGDSLRRQTQATAEWCERNGVTLDTSLTLRDLGVSAFRGAHRTGDKHALGAFLKLANQGRIPRGSFLVIENLDRLTREDERTAIRLWLDILDAGISIVQLKPETVFRHEKSEMLDVMRAILELSRGHGESRIKSERVSAAWGQRRADAREQGSVLTTSTPGWLEVVGRQRIGKHVHGGKFRLIPARVAVVQKIFHLACSGRGLGSIVRHLLDEGVPTWGRGKAWSKAYLHRILTGREVLGEHQPRRKGQPKKQQAAGPPIPGYYPSVPGIDEQTWQRAQAALASRKKNHGRLGKKVASLFTGLVFDARTGSRMIVTHQTRGSGKWKKKTQVIVPADSMEGRCATVSFPYATFEAAILSLLREVKAADVIGKEPPSESASLAEELRAHERRQGEVEAELAGDGEDVPGLVRVLRAMEDKRQELVKRLAAAQQKEANPRDRAWAEAKTLLDVATDEPTRLRLRGLLSAMVESIWVLIVPRAPWRLVAVQLHFTGDGHRDYLIVNKAADRWRKGGWQARSLPPELAGGQAFDLRKREHAQALERRLQNLDLAELTRG
jgi:DNA invertase Pin-like site-specific DNA recombinase